MRMAMLMNRNFDASMFLRRKMMDLLSNFSFDVCNSFHLFILVFLHFILLAIAAF